MDLNNLKSEPIVVLGGGFGGLSTVIALLAKTKAFPVILIDQHSRFLFKPFLYELLSDELQLWEVAPKFSSLASELGFIFLQDVVLEVDAIARKIVTSSGSELRYSQLVISTGVTTDFSGVKGLNEYAFGFSNLSDLEKIKKLINKINTFREYDDPLFVSGAGPTGVELACKLSDLFDNKLDIYLIEKGNKILPFCKSFNREKAIESLGNRNIKIYLEHSIRSIDNNYIRLSRVDDNTNKFQTITYSALIWTAVSKCNSSNLLHHFLSGKKKIKVNNFLQINGYQNIFFIGDMTFNENTFFPSSAQSAMQQGFLTAKNISSIRSGDKLKAFEFVDRGEMLSLGIGNASLTGYGLTMAGPLAFEIRRLAYLIRMPGFYLSYKSTGSWLFSKKLINRLFF